MSYTKLDSGILDSTIWRAPDPTVRVWITMLAMADQFGYVGASLPGLADRARVTLDACVIALDSFMAPDKWSRTKDNEGRRIAEANGGWVLLNYTQYRAVRDVDTRREQTRRAVAKFRARQKAAQAEPELPLNGEPVLADVSQGEPDVSQGEPEKANVSQSKPKQKQKQKQKKYTLAQIDADFAAFWSAYPRKVGQDAARKAFGKLDLSPDLVAAMIKAIKVQAQSWGEVRFIPHASTWINGGRWKDETSAAVNAPSVFEGAI